MIEVRSEGADPRAAWLRGRCAELGFPVDRVRSARLYRLEGLAPGELRRAARELLTDPVTERFRVRDGAGGPAGSWTVDVWYRPEVSDPAAESVEKGVRDLGLPAPSRVRCGQRTVLEGPRLGRADVERLAGKVLANPVVHEWRISR